MRYRRLMMLALLVGGAAALRAGNGEESRADHDARMAWWREARFGLFIHWGLYAVPAGEWEGDTDHGEWIRTSAKIPLRTYEGFVGKFNPVRFDPDAWVKMAKNAGMKYIVITSKHHDGFCLFDTKETDFNVMKTPFRKDVMKALAEACRKQGMKICWYHSIMDWHHPDYLPRREWETDRPDSGADFGRYVRYLKAELKELLTNYGPIGVLWFDGEWESTWNTTYGKELYAYVRSLQSGIIINNRVGAGRSGMEGFTKEGEFGGDFGTPEQEVPATGLPGVDWETCMTMNDHWGYNSHDTHWKSSKELIRTLVDVASKGGNFLLNVGPTAEGLFPEASIERLQAIGDWMKVNGDAIHGTTASPFKSLPWGRCTQRRTPGGSILYLHVFDWPAGGTLTIPGLLTTPARAYLVAGRNAPLRTTRDEDALVLSVPGTSPDTCDAVVALEFNGAPEINDPPRISADENIFVDRLSVALSSDRPHVEIRYTTDGSVPGASSPKADRPVVLTSGGTLSARLFRDGKPVSSPASAAFTKVVPLPASRIDGLTPGIAYRYFHGRWDSLPDFSALTPLKEGALLNFDTPRLRPENYAFVYDGFLSVPLTGVYALYTESDDGSRLYVDGTPVVDNDGLHGMVVQKGVIALGAGMHPLRVTYFNKSGGAGLGVSWRVPGEEKRPIPDGALFRRK
ncbi:MAG TPA: alpha-L-fucosidase [Bacteroidota bacterium]|nr:alpha-L-fucosidase [Bacteroidota bacterium]